MKRQLSNQVKTSQITTEQDAPTINNQPLQSQIKTEQESSMVKNQPSQSQASGNHLLQYYLEFLELISSINNHSCTQALRGVGST